jgi:hypothetical protein
MSCWQAMAFRMCFSLSAASPRFLKNRNEKGGEWWKTHDILFEINNFSNKGSTVQTRIRFFFFFKLSAVAFPGCSTDYGYDGRELALTFSKRKERKK